VAALDKTDGQANARSLCLVLAPFVLLVFRLRWISVIDNTVIKSKDRIVYWLYGESKVTHEE
jgi:hypothetical protein